VNRYRCSYTKIRHGEPQESLLGPLLFLLHINDLPLNIDEANLIMFANNINVPINDNAVGVFKTEMIRYL